ncbi:MAG: phosphodiester glycosidase family protein [Tildeniella nuda ZEHNDER 1965/U140]|nr:phosphodiester glycosidase family protein [Tildeniella nuda ZEHNDER 1965/U140]
MHKWSKLSAHSAHYPFQRSWLPRCLLLIAGALYFGCLSQLSEYAIAAPEYSQASLSQRDRISQATPLPAPSQQGNQILLNGRTLSAAWVQWSTNGQRFGISDAGLSQVIGVELLNTADATRQPVQWFSDPTTAPLNLPTWLTRTLRYLDITELAQRSGWQLQANGATLQITSPSATVLGIRQSRQPWGDRLVLDLDRSAPWQVDQQNQEVILTLDAQIPAALLQNFKPGMGNQLKAISVEPSANQTRIRLSLSSPMRPRVWSLPNANRLIVDVRPDAMVDRDILWAPGLRWRTQTLTVGTARFPVIWLAIDPRQPGVSLKPILPNLASLAGIAPLLRTAQQAQVAAAINGGFFNRNNQFPLGAVRLDGRWLSGPILGRGAIAWNASGDTKFDRLMLQEALITPNGQRLTLTHLNSAYIQAGIARYTGDWGTRYSPISDNEILVTVQNDRVINQLSSGAVGSTELPIPTNGYLLVLRSNRNALASLPVGASLRLETMVTPPEFSRYEQIIGGGPLLVRNRQIVLNPKAEQFSNAFAIEQANRSAIGQAADGNLLLVTVHNNLDGTGATLTDIAQIMQQMGAVNALNLDGGSSTTLYLGGQLLDRLPRTAARVHNGIGVLIQPNR